MITHGHAQQPNRLCLVLDKAKPPDILSAVGILGRENDAVNPNTAQTKNTTFAAASLLTQEMKYASRQLSQK